VEVDGTGVVLVILVQQLQIVARMPVSFVYALNVDLVAVHDSALLDMQNRIPPRGILSTIPLQRLRRYPPSWSHHFLRPLPDHLPPHFLDRLCLFATLLTAFGVDPRSRQPLFPPWPAGALKILRRGNL
jgi:hypothetical protein